MRLCPATPRRPPQRADSARSRCRPSWPASRCDTGDDCRLQWGEIALPTPIHTLTASSPALPFALPCPVCCAGCASGCAGQRQPPQLSRRALGVSPSAQCRRDPLTLAAARAGMSCDGLGLHAHALRPFHPHPQPPHPFPSLRPPFTPTQSGALQHLAAWHGLHGGDGSSPYVSKPRPRCAWRFLTRPLDKPVARPQPSPLLLAGRPRQTSL